MSVRRTHELFDGKRRVGYIEKPARGCYRAWRSGTGYGCDEFLCERSSVRAMRQALDTRGLVEKRITTIGKWITLRH